MDGEQAAVIDAVLAGLIAGVTVAGIGVIIRNLCRLRGRDIER